MLIFKIIKKINLWQFVQSRNYCLVVPAIDGLVKLKIQQREISKTILELLPQQNHILCLRITNRNISSMSLAKGSNRLVLEKSPYLLQHATNPVDWYPWSKEAFQLAQSENKPIFLSIGYSTCHWCHVMEKESFENDAVAEIMNKYFINIKVDREERPDVDKMYMSYIQAIEGHGGWPMSIFLTPTLEPIAGATYLPPETRYGRPGFKTYLLNIAQSWKDNKDELLAAGKQAVQILKKFQNPQSASSESPGDSCWKKCALQLSANYDSPAGGFSLAPKFPQPTNFNFLFHLYALESDTEHGIQCRDMCLNTLKRMAYGGIHDHVNNGFARYSVDGRWHVPHFEKMLYDQAQLAVSFCDAYVISKDEFYADVARDILTYVSRELSHPLGGFYGAQDADSYPFEGAPHKMEGAFCVWEFTEIANIISDDSTNSIRHVDIFIYHYNIRPEGNVQRDQDPHGELSKKNVLACFDSYESTATKFGITVEVVKEILKQCHRLLNEERHKRPKPDTDYKIVTSWNGLMISAFAKAGFILNEQSYVDRAVVAARFLNKYSYNDNEKSLLRCCYRDGDDDSEKIVQRSVPMQGFLDDYAFLIRGLLDLYEASQDVNWLQWAETLQDQQNNKFWDTSNGGFYSSPSNDTSVLIRGKDDQDGAEPCGNSVSVHNLIRLAHYAKRYEWQDKTREILHCFSNRLKLVPAALPEMVSGLMLYQKSPSQIFIAGSMEENSTKALVNVVRYHWIPGRLLTIVAPNDCSKLAESTEKLKLPPITMIDGSAAAYVCTNFTCHLPITNPDELDKFLGSIFVK